ncbi:serine hydrolase domain-containing protein [Halovenus marina]|uniref:serine hydrolase domain-containing protein n=1 Tax=Halovenus marina TaxID=3396621 RepID=UPI003F5582D8
MTAERLHGLLEAGHSEGLYPGAIARIGGPSIETVSATVGTHEPDGERPITPETRFDLASLTKPVVTTTLVFRLLESERLSLDETLGTYLPDLDGTSRGAIPIHTLLTHTSGLRAYAYDPDWECRDDVLAGLSERELCVREPGETFEYSCLNFLHLRELVARIVDESIETAVQEQLFDPVGMSDAAVGDVDPESVPVATTYEHEHADRQLRGTTHDPLARAMGGFGGNAGLFGTVEDVARFAEMILADGRAPESDAWVLSPASVRSFPVERERGEDVSQGYGWRLRVDRTPSPLWSAETIGHTGFTGTSLWVDLDAECYALLLTNAVHSPDSDLDAFRQRFHSLSAALATTG